MLTPLTPRPARPDFAQISKRLARTRIVTFAAKRNNACAGGNGPLVQGDAGSGRKRDRRFRAANAFYMLFGRLHANHNPAEYIHDYSTTMNRIYPKSF